MSAFSVLLQSLGCICLSVSAFLHCVSIKKHSERCRWILIFLALVYAVKQLYIFPSHLISASGLPYKTTVFQQMLATITHIANLQMSQNVW